MTDDIGEVLVAVEKHRLSLQQCVVPIFQDNDRGQPTVHGTALVVSFRKHIFLVSAAHVFDPIAEDKKMFIHSDRSTKRWISGQLMRTNVPVAKTRDDDLGDIGVLRLSGEGLPPYPSINCFPLPASRLLPGLLHQEGLLFLMLGFPSSRTKVNTRTKEVTTKGYANLGPSLNEKHFKKLGLDPRYHIAIAFHHGDVRGTRGTRQRFPDPHGMSGSPVWLVTDPRNPEMSDRLPVVAIVIEYRTADKMLLATNIGVAVEMMAKSIASESLGSR